MILRQLEFPLRSKKLLSFENYIEIYEERHGQSTSYQRKHHGDDDVSKYVAPSNGG